MSDVANKEVHGRIGIKTGHSLSFLIELGREKAAFLDAHGPLPELVWGENIIAQFFFIRVGGKSCYSLPCRIPYGRWGK